MWWINAVTWKDPSSAKFLTTASAISNADSGGMLSTNRIRSQLPLCGGKHSSVLSGSEETVLHIFLCSNIFYQLSAKLTQEMKIEHE
jgi:hypothetical protein